VAAVQQRMRRCGFDADGDLSHFFGVGLSGCEIAEAT